MTQEVASHKALAVMGGTYNPIHFGHLRAAVELAEVFQLAEVKLLPCNIPAHRQPPSIQTSDRLAMLALAVSEHHLLTLDDREISRQGVSYTIDTLRQYRAVYGENYPIYFALGADAFQHIHTWHESEAILSISHIVVMDRPGSDMINPLFSGQIFSEFLGHQSAFGKIYHLSLNALDISSTDIRKRVAEERSIDFFVPEIVNHYIKEKQLYR